MNSQSVEKKIKEGEETQIFITKLPLKVTKEEVEDLFDRYGKIENIIIKDTYVFVVIFFLPSANYSPPKILFVQRSPIFIFLLWR